MSDSTAVHEQDQGSRLRGDDAILERIRAYVDTPVSDYDTRTRLRPTEADIAALHTRAVRSPALWPLYHEANIVERADMLHHDGKFRGWSIAQLREQLSRIEGNTFDEDGAQVHEVIYHRYWPVARLIYRARTSPDLTIREVEWAYLDVSGAQSVDLDAEWERYRPGFEEESLLLAQKFPDVEQVKEVAFLPSANVDYRVVFSAGD